MCHPQWFISVLNVAFVLLLGFLEHCLYVQITIALVAKCHISLKHNKDLSSKKQLIWDKSAWLMAKLKQYLVR